MTGEKFTKKFDIPDFNSQSPGEEKDQKDKNRGYSCFQFKELDEKPVSGKDMNGLAGESISLREFSREELKKTSEIISRTGDKEKDKQRDLERDLKQKLEEIVSKEEEIIKKARDESAIIINKARQEAQEIEKNAYLQGYEKGEKLGLEIGEKKLRPLQGKYNDSISRVIDLYAIAAEKLEQELLNLSTDIARVIIKEEISSREDFVLGQIRLCLDKIADKENFTIKISEFDYQMLKDNRGSAGEIFKLGKGIKIKKDPKIERGSCIIENNYGVIDGSIDSQLKEIKSSFIEEYLKGSEK